MGDKGKLLIIEDDTDLVRALEVYFSRVGYEVSSAIDGREGLQKLYNERPDIVILDIALPKMDGWEVCSRIRELSDVPLVILTARVRGRLHRQAIQPEGTRGPPRSCPPPGT
jgi:DNA-binding response OmpR family regulator